MTDIVDSEKVASDTKAISLSHHIKSDDEAPRIPNKADDALRMIESGPTLGSVDPQKSKRLLRRIDLYVMPLICT